MDTRIVKRPLHYSADETPTLKRPRLDGAEPVRLCGIYLRDLLAFLPKAKVEELRQVSIHLNETILGCPQKGLPQRWLNKLLVLVESGERLEGENDQNRGSDFLAKSVREPAACIWHLTPEFKDCCRELKHTANALVEQHFFPNLPADDRVYLNVKCNERYALRMRNRLTKETAFPALHFLFHLDECYFSRIRLRLHHTSPIDETRPAMRLNEELLALLSGGRAGGGRGWLRSQQVYIGPPGRDDNFPVPVTLFTRTVHDSRILVRTAEYVYQCPDPERLQRIRRIFRFANARSPSQRFTLEICSREWPATRRNPALELIRAAHFKFSQ